MSLFLIESLYEIIHCAKYIPSTIVEEITKTSNDWVFFLALSRYFSFSNDFPYRDGKMRGPCRPHSANTICGSFDANFCLFMRFLVLIFLRQKVHRCYNIYGWYISVSISIFHAYFEFEDKVPQYAKLIVFDETGMWSKVTMRGSAKGLVSHWSDRQN